jgi:hypothetical protein
MHGNPLAGLKVAMPDRREGWLSGTSSEQWVSRGEILRVASVSAGLTIRRIATRPSSANQQYSAFR